MYKSTAAIPIRVNSSTSPTTTNPMISPTSELEPTPGGGIVMVVGGASSRRMSRDVLATPSSPNNNIVSKSLVKSISKFKLKMNSYYVKDIDSRVLIYVLHT